MTLGVVYTPSQVEGLSIVLNAWAIELTNIVAGIGASQTISRCYVESAVQDDAFCSFVVRTPSGAVQEIRTSSINAAINNVEGIDFGIRYDFDVENYGSFVTAFDVTYYTKDEFAQAQLQLLLSVLVTTKALLTGDGELMLESYGHMATLQLQ